MGRKGWVVKKRTEAGEGQGREREREGGGGGGEEGVTTPWEGFSKSPGNKLSLRHTS